MTLRIEPLGAWGAGLTLVILASSVLLRLATTIDAGGATGSILPDGIELSARIAHRLSAMAVGILAIVAALAVAARRPVPRPRALAAVAIVAITIVLALVGRYTPGYRVIAITIVNVVGGMGLACAFWWLREECRAGAPARAGRTFLAPALALAALLVHAGVEAAASALALHGGPAPTALHLATGVAVVVLAFYSAWRERDRQRMAALVALAAVSVQFACTLALAFMGTPRPAIAGWLHPMAGAVAAIAFVSLAVRAR